MSKQLLKGSALRLGQSNESEKKFCRRQRTLSASKDFACLTVSKLLFVHWKLGTSCAQHHLVLLAWAFRKGLWFSQRRQGKARQDKKKKKKKKKKENELKF